jgi:hypothetical protein
MVCAASQAGHVTLEAYDPADTAIVRLSLSPAALPALAAAVHEASGTPEPVILGRCDTSPGKTITTPLGSIGADGRDVVIAGPQAASLSPAQARAAAAALVTYADIAEQEPDPDEVSALAGTIRAELPRGQHKAGEVADRAARAVLQAGYQPPCGTWRRDATTPARPAANPAGEVA